MRRFRQSEDCSDGGHKWEHLRQLSKLARDNVHFTAEPGEYWSVPLSDTIHNNSFANHEKDERRGLYDKRAGECYGAVK